MPVVTINLNSHAGINESKIEELSGETILMCKGNVQADQAFSDSPLKSALRKSEVTALRAKGSLGLSIASRPWLCSTPCRGNPSLFSTLFALKCSRWWDARERAKDAPLASLRRESASALLAGLIYRCRSFAFQATCDIAAGNYFGNGKGLTADSASLLDDLRLMVGHVACTTTPFSIMSIVPRRDLKDFPASCTREIWKLSRRLMVAMRRAIGFCRYSPVLGNARLTM